MGCTTWPDREIFSKCRLCGESTRLVNGDNVTPISEEEAESLVLHDEFEKYYARRCQRIGIPSDGPLPENYARSLGSLV